MSHLVRWALLLMAAKLMLSALLDKYSERQCCEVVRKELSFRDKV